VGDVLIILPSSSLILLHINDELKD
jgi:hypothetical protein